jgi:predicted acyltransferase
LTHIQRFWNHLVTPQTSSRETTRLRSIDALRGFDMFWIIGGDSLFKALGVLLGIPVLVEQLEHVKWEGFRFYDLIFPLFLFIVGAVLPFSLAKYTDGSGGRGDRRHAYRRIFLRTLLLIALGLIYNDILKFDFTNFRWPGVLQRIGLCYFFAALAVLHLGVAGQTTLLAILLAGYWALLRFVAAPAFAPFDLSPEGNLVGYVDRLLIPGRLYYGHGDNEGLLSTLPAIGTTLLGTLAGHWLRSRKSALVKVLGLILAAAACWAGGEYWNQTFPLIKNLWTSSYVLVAGGYSLALLALFYLLIDVAGFHRWAFFFVVIGMNAVTIYVMQDFVGFRRIAEYFVGGLMKLIAPATDSITAASGRPDLVLLWVAVIAIKWLILLYLYRNKTFLRV